MISIPLKHSTMNSTIHCIVIFTSRLYSLLRQLTEEYQPFIDKLEYRTKSVESFLGKLGRKTYQSPFEDIKDFAGLRIITFYQDSVPKIVESLRREFVVIEEESHRFDRQKPDEFGYGSLHLIVSLPASRLALKEWKQFEGLQAEIQVRSILQHAWANMSHKIDYKAKLQAPVELQRRLFRLSALLELADEEFKSILEESDRIARMYTTEVSRGELGIPLNLDSLREFVTQKVDLPYWEQFGCDAGMEQFPDLDHTRTVFTDRSGNPFINASRSTSHDDCTNLKHYLNAFEEAGPCLRQFVTSVRMIGETIHALPIDVLVILLSCRCASEISEDFTWGGTYKPFFVEALHSVLRSDRGEG